MEVSEEEEEGLGFRRWGSGDYDSGFWVQGLGLRVQKVQSLVSHGGGGGFLGLQSRGFSGVARLHIIIVTIFLLLLFYYYYYCTTSADPENHTPTPKPSTPPLEPRPNLGLEGGGLGIQGYRAYKKPHHPRTLQ